MTAARLVVVALVVGAAQALVAPRTRGGAGAPGAASSPLPGAARSPPMARPQWKRIGAAAAAAAEPAAEVMLDEGSLTGTGFLSTVYKFARPHTIRGTMLASVAGVARALRDAGGIASVWRTDLLPRAALGALALLCGNLFIVGINQIYDVDVDKVNKPFLPIAAGELSMGRAKAVLAACALVGPLVTYTCFSPLIFQLYMLGTTVGTLYSVPPFALKQRGPLFAGVSIATCRGFLLNFGVYYATLEALGVPFAWNPTVAFMARFMTVFAAVIAVTKDLPDVEGDKKFAVKTLATKYGVAAVAQAACVMLGLNYASAIAQGVLAPAAAFHKVPMVAGHSALLVMLLRNVKLYLAQGADNMSAVKGLYKRIWDLFYLEYALYVFI